MFSRLLHKLKLQQRLFLLNKGKPLLVGVAGAPIDAVAIDDKIISVTSAIMI